MLRIEIKSSKTKCEQIQISDQKFTSTDYQHCIISLSSQQQHLDREEYQFSRDEWMKLPLVGANRVIRLRFARKFFSDVVPLASSSSLRIEQPIVEDGFMVLDECHPLDDIKGNIISIPKKEEDDVRGDCHQIFLYISFLFDFYLMREDLSEMYQTLCLEEFWKYILRQRNPAWYGRMSYFFISTIISIETLPQKHIPPLVELWLDWEMILFRKSIHLESYRREFMLNIIPSHLTRVVGQSVTLQWQHARWHLYLVGDGKVWLQHGQRYLISIYWLIHMPLSAGGGGEEPIPDGERPGFVWIKEVVFYEKFLPVLYEKYLEDLLAMLRYQILAKPTDYSDYYGCMMQKELKKEFLYGRLENVWGLSSLDLYEFNLSHAQNHSSPVIEQFMNVEGLEDGLGTRKSGKKKKMNGGGGGKRIFQGNNSQLPSDVVDIEDLFRKPNQLLPPCLSALVEKSQRDWCKYKDRMTLVKSLLDMGYEENIVEIMAINRNNVTDRKQVENLVKSYKKKKQASNNDAVSVCCGTIINSFGGEGEIIRCKYEEALNGEKRVFSLDEDKNRFCSDCASSIGLSYMNHPMDYVEHQLSLSKNPHKM